MIGIENSVAAYIPARIGSRRLPRKNVLTLAGKPLIRWVLESAELSSKIDEVWLNTDSEEIVQAAKRQPSKVRVHRRSSSLAKDSTSTEEILADILPSIETDFIVAVNPTNPLLSPKTLDDFISHAIQSSFDTAFSVSRIQKHLFRDGIPLNFNPFGPHPRTQDVEPLHALNWAIVLWDRKMAAERIRKRGDSIYLGRVGFIETPASESFDIDTVDDWKLVEAFLARQQV